MPIVMPVVSEPTSPGASARLADIWAARDLLIIFVQRDIKLRYSQTAVGVAWAILQPLVLMLAP